MRLPKHGSSVLLVTLVVAASRLSAQGPCGSFGGPPVLWPASFASAGPAAAIATGDLDNDGDIDIALVRDSFEGTAVGVTILLNDGAGGVATAFDVPTGDTLASIAVSDVNGDNAADIVCGTYGVGLIEPKDAVKVVVLTNDGGGTFSAIAKYPIVVPNLGYGNIAVGDVSGDGRPDVVTALFDFYTVPANGRLFVSVNNGFGGFASPIAYNAPTGGSTVSLAHLNPDGKLDILCGAPLVVLLNAGGGTFPSYRSYPVNATDLAPGDLDGDVDVDVAVVTNQGKLEWWRNKGNGSLTPAGLIHVPIPSDCYLAQSIESGKVNCDEKTDLVAGISCNTQGSAIAILTSTGTGTFVVKVHQSAMIPGQLDGYLTTRLADFDGNDRADIATLVGSGVALWMNSGAVGLPMGNPGGNIIGYCAKTQDCTGGTLGCLVTLNGEQHVLSNNHVFNPGGWGFVGADIETPCSSLVLPTAIHVADFVGDLVPLIPLPSVNKVDAAIAKVVPGALAPSGTILGLGVPCSQPTQAKPDWLVKKSGAVTGVTTGKVVNVGWFGFVRDVDPCGGSPILRLFTDQVVIRGTAGSPFGQPGDSGALVVTATGLQPVGLVFAGSQKQALANDIGNVIEAFAAAGQMQIVGDECGSGTEAASSGCLPEEEVANARHAVELHWSEMLRLPGVIGIGVGVDESNDCRVAITVHVEAGTPIAHIPKMIGGVSVQVTVTDIFWMW